MDLFTSSFELSVQLRLGVSKHSCTCLFVDILYCGKTNNYIIGAFGKETDGLVCSGIVSDSCSHPFSMLLFYLSSRSSIYVRAHTNNRCLCVLWLDFLQCGSFLLCHV